ncbi:MAG: dienelactone hydrolase family protein [Anaerolineae bacterium]|nr:dienelactone hydrolase family protein [Anaerolineae bacterium]
MILRVSHLSSSSRKLCLLLHGWNGDENSMQIFFSDFSEEYAIIAPRAFYPTEEGGYTWAPSFTKWSRIPDVEPKALDELSLSAEKLYSLIPQWIKFFNLNISEIVLAGFSQGAAMSLLLGFCSPNSFNKIACMSGFLPVNFQQRVETSNILNKNILIAHGTQDDIIPIEKARHLHEQLTNLGANVEYCEDATGHKMSLSCRKKLKVFFA